MRSHTALALSLFVVVAGTACKKKEPALPIDTTPVAAPAPPPATVSTIELGKKLGPNKRVTDTTSVFGRRDTFYLAVVTENTAPSATLVAKWSFQTGQTVDSTSQAVAAPDSANTVSVTEFHVAKPSGWPVGKYKVEVWLDGVSKGSRDFEVKR
ncbi:MAG: hypothetical protein IT359_16375 [Gemmatimonadaceae bacterium]|nr:hypothetical protein [Gemmatimonadaceae bacterium]